MKRLLVATAALTGALGGPLAAPMSAWAGPPPGHGNPHGTPPGLAKKPYGMPPGQAKKWGVGERLPAYYVTEERYIIYEPARYHLRPPPYGYRWVRVDDDYYLAQTRTGLIAEVVAALLR